MKMEQFLKELLRMIEQTGMESWWVESLVMKETLLMGWRMEMVILFSYNRGTQKHWRRVYGRVAEWRKEWLGKDGL